MFSPEMARFGRAEEVKCEAAAGDLNVVFNYLMRMQRETRAKPFLKGYRIRCNKDKAETGEH